MSQRNEPVEFIRLNGQAVRATSWTPTDASGFRLVVVVRGVGEANSLANLFEQSPLELELPGEELMDVTIAHVERREAGEPPVVITRFEVLFEIAGLNPQLVSRLVAPSKSGLQVWK